VIVSRKSRWMLLPALLISAVLWLGLSSVIANAIHVLAKGNFAFGSFGSISAMFLAAAFGWTMLIGYWVNVEGDIEPKILMRGACAIAIWLCVLIAFTAVADDFLVRLGRDAISVWVAELTVAMVLFIRVTKAPLSFWRLLQCVLVVLVCLTAVKALLLLMSPGIAIRLQS
jgi:hypothetical protein